MDKIDAVLIGLLCTAAFMDLKFGRIYNEWILLMITAGLCTAVWANGMEGLFFTAGAAVFPVILLYPLFRIGGLGGGDIKLFAAVGSFIGIKNLFVCILVSFAAGAVMSFFKMLLDHNFTERFQYLMSYVCGVFHTGEFKLYKSGQRERIHFAPAILIGTVLVLGGIV